MYCIKCGAKLADTEKVCPLCNTVVYHPDLTRTEARPLYPPHKFPPIKKRSKTLNGAILFMFFLPALISLIVDWQAGGGLTWFGFVVGALAVLYAIFALPFWFAKPNPVIFVPCAFAAIAVYVLYICLVTGGNWYLSFAFPILGAYTVICSAVVTLLHYLKKGRLYIWGGAFLAVGIFMLPIELLMCTTFVFDFKGWSLYPLLFFVFLGGLLIYLAINRSAREMMERKFFF